MFARALLGSFLLFAATSIAEAHEFHWKLSEEKGEADLYHGEAPILRYMYALDESSDQRAHETYKVFHHVFGPGTKSIITKGPGGKYTHHRGMFIGFNKTQFEGGQLDFWHCKNGAKLRHVKFLALEGDAKSGRMTAEIHWTDKAGKPVIVEHRTVVATEVDHGWQFDWSTKLMSRRGKITLTGDRQHAGFQYRAAQPVAEANSARYIRPAGAPQQSEAFQVGGPVKHTNLKWFAMTYPLAGKTYTVQYLENPTHDGTSRYSERPYGRFGVFFEAELDEATPLAVGARVIVTEGDVPSREAIQANYDAYAKAAQTK